MGNSFMQRVLNGTTKTAAHGHSINLSQPHSGVSAGTLKAKAIASKLTGDKQLSSEEIENLADAHNGMHPFEKRMLLMTSAGHENAAQTTISNARMNHAIGKKATSTDKLMFLTVATNTNDKALEAQASSNMMRFHAENGAEPCAKKANAWAQHILDLESADDNEEINQKHVSDAWDYLITQGMKLVR